MIEILIASKLLQKIEVLACKLTLIGVNSEDATNCLIIFSPIMKLLLIIVNLQAKLERFGKKLDQKNFFNFFSHTVWTSIKSSVSKIMKNWEPL